MTDQPKTPRLEDDRISMKAHVCAKRDVYPDGD